MNPDRQPRPGPKRPPIKCTRCNGTGYIDSGPNAGTCYECNGTGEK